MAKGMGLTRRAMIALAGLGGMVAGGTVFGTAAARAQPPPRPRRHERLHRALREMRDAMEYIRDARAGRFQEHHKKRSLEALEVAIRNVEEMMREER
jgi:hypothetical protein